MLADATWAFDWHMHIAHGAISTRQTVGWGWDALLVGGWLIAFTLYVWTARMDRRSRKNARDALDRWIKR